MKQLLEAQNIYFYIQITNIPIHFLYSYKLSFKKVLFVY